MLHSLLIPYPHISPTLIEIGPFAIRWYALAYIAGLVLGWQYIVMMMNTPRLWVGAPDKKPPVTPIDADDILLFATLGVVLGGRIGYILFYGLVYQPDYYLGNPLHMFEIWKGGMSFHGGLLGVTLGLFILCRMRKLDLLRVGDLVAPSVPIGLFFGRIANFINDELWGRGPTTVPWAMIFPSDPRHIPRHPSQLYEASLEGLALFVILRFLTHHTRALERPGLVSGVFFAWYGTARAFCEFFREPEDPIGQTGITMGMLLSVPMWAFAAWAIWRALKPKPTAVSSPQP